MRRLSEELANNKGMGPGFHFLRHVLSVIILFHHSYVLTFGGIGYVKNIMGEKAASLPRSQMFIEIARPGIYSLIAAFFALSGFLVAGSALRTRNIPRFLWLRVLRITPALCTEVTLSAIFLGMIFTTLGYSEYFSSLGFYRYFGNIFGFITFTLPGVFTGNPHPDTVNANLWTLPAEFYCYALMVALMATGIIYKRARFLLLFIIGYVAISAGIQAMPDVFLTRANTTHFTAWFIVYCFFTGILFYLFADKVRLSPLLFLFCGVGYFAFMFFNVSDAAAVIMLVYCVVYLGMTKFSLFDRAIKGDYSYGIYLFGYPITQAVIATLSPAIQPLHGAQKFAAVAIPSYALTFLFAYLSWNCIEKSALRLKNYQFLSLFKGEALQKARAFDAPNGMPTSLVMLSSQSELDSCNPAQPETPETSL